MPTPRGAAHRRGVRGRARVLGLATLLFLVSSCGSGDLPLAVVDPAAAPAQPTYEQAKRILDRYCLPCHVDPDGGGMRNTSGRFFGRATLPMIASSPRPTMDWDRWAGKLLYRRDRATSFTDSLPQGPRNFAESRDSRYGPRERLAVGAPLGGSSALAPLAGRYGAVNADPLFRVSWDLRFATLLAGENGLTFPMQADLGATLQPSST